MNKKAHLLCGIALLCCVSAQGNAQSTDPTPAAGSSGDSQQVSDAEPQEQSAAKRVEADIIVTARRRAESSQRVPETVQSISDDKLREQNITNVRDLQYIVPGLAGSTNTPNQIRLTLRGQGASGNLSSPAVIFFANEVPVPNFPGGAMQIGPDLFFDLDNIQVLKGPQGTLFGRGAAGGSILINSARPTNELGGYVRVGLGSYGNRELAGVLNIPVIDDKLLVRLAAMTQKSRGYTRILGTPSDPNGIRADNRDTHSVRGTITFKPTDDVRSDLILTDTSYDATAAYGVLSLVLPGGALATRYPQALDLYKQQQDLGIRTLVPVGVDPKISGKTTSVTSITSVKIAESITVKGIFGYYSITDSFAGDQDNTVLPWFDVYATPRKQTIQQWTQELQLQGTALGGIVNWVVGGFNLNSPTPNKYAIENLRLQGSEVYVLNRRSDRSKGAFAHAILDMGSLVKGMRLSAGVRRSEDSFSQSSYGTIPGFCFGDSDDCIAGPENTTSGKSKATTWTLGIDQQINDRTMVYITAKSGYRPGGTQGFDRLTNFDIPDYGPEYVLQTEAGIKSDWSLGSVPIRTNASIWVQRYTDIQQQVLHPVSEGGAYTENAGRARLWGAELELSAAPSSNLDLGVRYGYGTIKYLEFKPGVGAEAIDQLNKTKTLNFPPHKLNLFASYYVAVPESWGTVTFNANYNWQSKSGWKGIVNELGMQKAFGLLNGSIDWKNMFGKRIDGQLYASNLTNEAYATQTVQAWMPLYYGYGNKIYGEPRQFGARLTYHF